MCWFNIFIIFFAGYSLMVRPLKNIVDQLVDVISDALVIVICASMFFFIYNEEDQRYNLSEKGRRRKNLGLVLVYTIQAVGGFCVAILLIK